MIDTFLHRWLRIPYALHAEIQKPARKPIATVVLIHGIGNSGRAWADITAQLPANVRVVTIDLLGFGESPRPSWATYDAKVQARSVITTLIKLRLTGKVVLVGHSLGSLVAIEVAARYPLIIKSLVLYAPPFYRVNENRRLLPSSHKTLRKMHHLARKHPERLVTLSKLAHKLGLVNKTFDLTRDNAAAYLNALESSILNQTSLKDAAALKVPTHIIYGRLDPVIVASNIRWLARINKNVRITGIVAGHEVKGVFVKPAVEAIKEAIKVNARFRNKTML